MYEELRAQARQAAEELVQASGIRAGQILVVGCSSSEIGGGKIGSSSSPEVAEAVFSGIWEVLKEKGIFLAAQCCEHLNRAIILEREAAERYGYEQVNVVPQPKAGGSFATAAYAHFAEPVAVEQIAAHAGLDIGNTLIGMHLRAVAVPLRIAHPSIGCARIVCARTRAKYIGGERAHYNEEMA